MRIAIILAITLIAIPGAAIAADECGEPYKGGNPAQAMMDVVLQYGIEACEVLWVEGPVTVDMGDCETLDAMSCTWSAQGDPNYEGNQNAAIRFTWEDCDEPVVCSFGVEILPVELLSFDVE